MSPAGRGTGRPVPNGKVAVVPSLLAADFADIRGGLRPLRRGGLRWASVDVMDGHFVPNISFGPDLVRSLKKKGAPKLDAHLMVSDPGKMGPVFAEAGADWVVFHLEACPRPRALLKRIRGMGAGVGLAVKPRTRAELILPYLKEIDLALVMTVEPGFGGQRFMKGMLSKVRMLRREIDRRGLPVWLQVDGGVDAETAPLAAAAGADSLVAGSAVFGARRPAAAMRRIEKAAQKEFRRSFLKPGGR